MRWSRRSLAVKPGRPSETGAWTRSTPSAPPRPAPANAPIGRRCSRAGCAGRSPSRATCPMPRRRPGSASSTILGQPARPARPAGDGRPGLSPCSSASRLESSSVTSEVGVERLHPWAAQRGTWAPQPSASPMSPDQATDIGSRAAVDASGSSSDSGNCQQASIDTIPPRARAPRSISPRRAWRTAARRPA